MDFDIVAVDLLKVDAFLCLTVVLHTNRRSVADVSSFEDHVAFLCGITRYVPFI